MEWLSNLTDALNTGANGASTVLSALRRPATPTPVAAPATAGGVSKTTWYLLGGAGLLTLLLVGLMLSRRGK